MVGVSNANASKEGLGRRPTKSTVHGAMELLCYLLFHVHPLLQNAITICYYYMLTPQSITWHCPNGESRRKETMQNMHSMSQNGTLVEEWHVGMNNSIGFRRLLLCLVKSQSIKYTLEAD